jgi:hypothetical protein
VSVGTLTAQQLRSLVEDKWHRDADAVAVGLHVARPWRLPEAVEFEFGTATVVRACSSTPNAAGGGLSC